MDSNLDQYGISIYDLEKPHAGVPRKNRRKWCGGHVGRKHTPEWVTGKYTFSTIDDMTYRCKRCKKEFGSVWSGFRRHPTQYQRKEIESHFQRRFGDQNATEVQSR